MGVTALFSQAVRMLTPERPDRYGVITGIVVGDDGNTDLRVVLLDPTCQAYTQRDLFIRLLVVNIDHLVLVS